MPDHDWKWGECPWCKEQKYLYLTIGQYKGRIICDWVCQQCCDAVRGGRKHEEVQASS